MGPDGMLGGNVPSTGAQGRPEPVVGGDVVLGANLAVDDDELPSAGEAPTW